jgi:hypothetical protein
MIILNLKDKCHVRGKCDSCGIEDVEIQPYKLKNEEWRNVVINVGQQMVHTDSKIH